MSALPGHDLHVNDGSAAEAYLGRVRGLRMLVGDDLPATALAEVDSLIEHGEPAEGVCSLAWALHNAHITVTVVNDGAGNANVQVDLGGGAGAQTIAVVEGGDAATVQASLQHG